MRADPPRDNLPSQMRVGDPLAMGHYLLAMDESVPFDSCNPQPSVPPANHLEQARTMDAKIGRMGGMGDIAADHRAKAERYKAMWLCELLRGDHEDVEPYSASELKRAEAEAESWQTFEGENGDVTAYKKHLENRIGS